jgi:hypothetical protein
MSSTTSSKTPSAEDKFVKNINGFCDFGEGVLTELYKAKKTSLSPSGIGYAIGYANGKIKDKGGLWILEDFIKRTVDYWPEIKKKNAEFFFDKMGKLVPVIEKEHMNELTRIFSSGSGEGDNDKKSVEKKSLLDQDDIDCFWEYIHSFVKISINHIHKTRKPIMNEDKKTYTYQIEYMKDISVRKNAELFDIKLSA